jgi:putative flippase GtrA
MSVREKEPALRAVRVATVARLGAPIARRWPAQWERLVRFLRFGLVGASGIFVNELTLALVVALGAHDLIGVLVATQASSTWNFVLVELWAFRGRTYHRRLWHRFLMFFAVNNVALLLRGPIIIGLDHVGVPVLVSNLISLVVLIIARFGLSDSLIWGPGKAETESALTGVPEEELEEHAGLDRSRVIYVAGDVDVTDLGDQTTGGGRRVVDLTEEVTARHADQELRAGGSRRRFPVPDVSPP